jgi:hypothetical protein
MIERFPGGWKEISADIAEAPSLPPEGPGHRMKAHQRKDDHGAMFKT